jgi:hypothetical protein
LANEPLVVEVWLDVEKPKLMLVDEVRIEDGETADKITFRVRMDSDVLEFRPTVQDLDVWPYARSEAAHFSFSAPSETGEYVAWIQLSQKNRLIQVLPMRLEIGR